MTVSEKAAYFKGLVEGLGADKDARQGKLWTALTDLLSDIAGEITELKDTSLDFADTLDEFSEDLAYLEEITCDLNVPEDFEDPSSAFDSDPVTCSGECESCGLCGIDEEEPAGKTISFEDYLDTAYGDEAVSGNTPEPEYYDFRKEEGLRDEDEEPSKSQFFDFHREDTEASPEPEDEEPEYDGVVYDVTCPSCGEEISFDEDTLSKGFIICPNCGEKLEFDLSEE